VTHSWPPTLLYSWPWLTWSRLRIYPAWLYIYCTGLTWSRLRIYPAGLYVYCTGDPQLAANPPLFLALANLKQAADMTGLPGFPALSVYQTPGTKYMLWDVSQMYKNEITREHLYADSTTRVVYFIDQSVPFLSHCRYLIYIHTSICILKSVDLFEFETSTVLRDTTRITYSPQ